MYVGGRIREKFFGKVKIRIGEVPDIATVNTREVD